jgi:hypothetical protein
MTGDCHVRFCERRGVRFPPATHLVVLVHGQRDDVETLREAVAQVLAPLGLKLSPAKTTVVHMSDGFDFLGFRIQWKRRRGSDKWYVYTFIADRPFRAVKAKIRALTHRVSQANMGTVITRINQILRGWTNYFRHAVCKHTFSRLRHFVNWRLIRWLRKRHRLAVGSVPPPLHHRQRAVAAVRGRWSRGVQPRIGDSYAIPIPGKHDPEPLPAHEPCLTEPTVESPVRGDTHAGFGERPEETGWQ